MVAGQAAASALFTSESRYGDAPQLGLGIVGVGDILSRYMDTRAVSDEVEVRFLPGLNLDQAPARAAELGVPGHGTYDDLLADPTTAEIEVSGTEGALRFPDSNRLDGDSTVFPRSLEGDVEVVAPGATGGSGRGSGIADMARSLHGGVPHRADARLASHVLDTMLATARSAESGQAVDLVDSCASAALLPEGWRVEA